MAPVSDTFTLDPLRAGWCAQVTGPASIEHPAVIGPCLDAIAFAGWVQLGARRRVVAFSCGRHRTLLDEPAVFGADPRHRAELARRRHRDRWLRG
jgi:hypothetical protein